MLPLTTTRYLSFVFPATSSSTFVQSACSIVQVNKKLTCGQYLQHRHRPFQFQAGISNSFSYSSHTPRSYPSSSLCSQQNNEVEGIRINKCFKSFASRRESDVFVSEQRVTVNDEIAHPGTRVKSGDIVKLDGKIIEWERLTIDIKTNDFIYIKHWKAENVICTTDNRIMNNIIDNLNLDSFTSEEKEEEERRQDRIFPVGRLDEASTGIILLTSDGRLPNRVLGMHSGCDKQYLVVPDLYVRDKDLEELEKGVVITTEKRDSGSKQGKKARISKTLPCKIERSGKKDLVFTLREGRNRQIRKMLGHLGYTTRAIHRISFMGISLDGLKGPGDSCHLNEQEMEIIRNKLI